MKYMGVLIAESLIDEAFLNFVSITERKEGIIKFSVNDDFAAAVTEEISKSLKPRGWYASMESEYEKFTIFPNKIFKYTPKDAAIRQKALEYAKSLGIPDAQLDGI